MPFVSVAGSSSGMRFAQWMSRQPTRSVFPPNKDKTTFDSPPVPSHLHPVSSILMSFPEITFEG